MSPVQYRIAIGLLETLFARRLSPRWAYGVIGAATIGLTWATDVLSIISLASRAFALFYALQCWIAVAVARRQRDVPRRGVVMAGGVVLGVVCLMVTLFGIPAE